MIKLIDDTFNFNGFTVIIPAIGVGNVAQLASDLIISTLYLKRVGSGFNEGCMPIFGPPAYGHDSNMTTSLELYADLAKKLLIFQIRSPIVSALLEKFQDDIMDFLVKQEIKKIFILSSSHLYEKHHTESFDFAYLENDNQKRLHSSDYSRFPWTEFTGSRIFGGGNANKLLVKCEEANIPAIVIFKYVAEGDNSKDAALLLSELNRVLPMFEKQSENYKLTVPSSWNFLFGNQIPELIF